MTQAVNPPVDSHMHIAKTTKQWEDRAIANWIVPRGCLCIEFTTDFKTKAKIGEGNKYYHQLPYIGDGSGGDLSNYYTKQEIDVIVKNLDYIRLASTTEFPSKESLPKIDNKLGDVRFVRTQPNQDPITYMWNGTKWISVTGITESDLSQYAKKSEVEPRLQQLESVAHTHNNKSTLDQLTQTVIDDTHKHDNLSVLDQISQTLIDDSHSHDNENVLDQLTQPVIDYAHRHENLSVLDATTASYTTQEKEKLASLQNYEPFIGTDGNTPGSEGLVPTPQITDVDKYLASDGTWKPVEAGDIPIASDTTIGGIKVGDGLTIDPDGTLNVEGSTGESKDYIAGDGIIIDEAPEFLTIDLMDQLWQQGTVDASTGVFDPTNTKIICSPMIKLKTNDFVWIDAETTSSVDLLWKMAVYDDAGEFISLSDQWYHKLDGAREPLTGKQVRILLTVDALNPFSVSQLQTCTMTVTNKPDTFVITNSGVTDIALHDAQIVMTKNGTESTLIEFGDDLTVQDGVVNIADINRLILNVET